ncbi:conjugative transposon protein TraJ [Chitinophaga sp. MM2321]|uniref:conjugative transposon protein TraJ n=1 Tax=Chitinophaga sp. MM2321 TaxID=3137178 RepID=UPI0032D5945C
MKTIKVLKSLWILTLTPIFSYGQGVADNIHSMQDVLTNLYEEMMPLCSGMIDIAQGIAGFAALFYIAARVWKQIMNAEAIDFYPLFRPFILGFCIAGFPILVMGTLNGILQPISDGTGKLVENSNQTVKMLLKQKEDVLKKSPLYQMYVGQDNEGNRDQWYRYTHNNEDPSGEDFLSGIGNDLRFTIAKATFKLQNSIKEYMSEVLRILFEAAALCINTIRTFQMIVLTILGPLVFGLSVFDGLQHTLGAWIAKYINVFLWLPVANLFSAIIGKVQENLIRMDIGQIARTGDTFFSPTDTGYLVFLLIGIVGYFTVPSVAGFVVNAGGGGAMVQKLTSLTSSAPGMAMNTGGKIGGAADTLANMKQNYEEGRSGKSSGDGVAGALGRAIGRAYMADKLKGNEMGSKKG